MDKEQLIFLGACLLAGGRWASPYYDTTNPAARNTVTNYAILQAADIYARVFETNEKK